jgi:hypothetical protein
VTVFQRRLIILFDEWLGATLCCWTYDRHREAFPYVLAAIIIGVYVLGYIPFWLKHDRWWR